MRRCSRALCIGLLLVGCGAAQTPQAPVKGVSFELIPIYGVTIPVVVRMGNLSAKVGITNVAMAKSNGKPAVSLDLTRAGDRSVFGDIRVFKQFKGCSNAGRPGSNYNGSPAGSAAEDITVLPLVQLSRELNLLNQFHKLYWFL